MVTTIEPHVEGVQLAGAAGAAGVAGADDDEYPIPPPQALKAVISKAPAAAGSHRRRFTHALVARGEQSIDVSSFW
ncbi:MAG TPA: hypothetical protein VGI90_12995 [Steroidobacteraceae bacterium]|jgi:hypothetical protein